MKTALRVILIITGIFSLIYSIEMLAVLSFNLGYLLPGLFGALIFIAAVFWDKISSVTNAGIGKKLKIAFFICLAFVILSFTIMCVAVRVISNRIPADEKDVVIVLGAGLRGEQVSSTLALRLDKAAEYLRRNPDTIVVVSGGRGDDEPIPEALAMERYLTAGGIEPNRIYKEDKSLTTLQNFKYSKVLLDGLFAGRPYSAVFVSNDFHMLRAGLMAAKTGLDAEGFAAPSQFYMLPSYYSREYLALLYFLVFEAAF